MAAPLQFFGSTIGRKILMALSGFILTGFVLVHMLGNLTFLISPDAINLYAHHLQSLPLPILWGFRAVILLAVVVHVWAAISLAKEKLDARPEPYTVEKTVQASYASRTMMMSGLIILAFFIFHILHFTVKIAPAPYTPEIVEVQSEGVTLHLPNVYKMMVDGFSNIWISGFYILATGLLCLHLSHGVSSMLQTLGARNEAWRYTLGWLALGYGWLIFIGFAIIPLSVLAGWKA